METNIIIRTHFPAFHRWSDCNIPEVDFLKNLHRHVFHVTMKWNVNHFNRDLEFIKMKNEVEEYIRTTWWNKDLGNMSCEMICKKLTEIWDIDYVSVFEDDENGAEIYV